MAVQCGETPAGLTLVSASSSLRVNVKKACYGVQGSVLRSLCMNGGALLFSWRISRGQRSSRRCKRRREI